ncbi:hypothetical protein KY308_03055 [Candidatus Woesearchaeota archaeon]|nr:hypothetical protein [Candidatus Woesearchaeota archaeon]
MPQELLERIKQVTEETGTTRSYFIQEASKLLLLHISAVQEGFEPRYVKKENPNHTKEILVPMYVGIGGKKGS